MDAATDTLDTQVGDGPANPDHGLDGLTQTELNTLSLLARGYSNVGIATELWLTPRTVEGRISALFDKLGMVADPSSNRRVLAAMAYLRHGDVNPALPIGVPMELDASQMGLMGKARTAKVVGRGLQAEHADVTR